ncbi:MAG: hypothetical protein K6B75_07670 [Lachnospiraceae bacterium]|nr:hypothetical protein [Lachnospiraceae bacterium]
MSDNIEYLSYKERSRRRRRRESPIKGLIIVYLLAILTGIIVYNILI